MLSITPKWNGAGGVIAAMFLAAILGSAWASKAVADERDQRTMITFSGPVEIPGAVLPPGTYVFRLLDSTANRHIVQIVDQDQKHVYATVFSVPDYRLEPTDHTVIQFKEGPSGSPAAIKAWFYPGDLCGQVICAARNSSIRTNSQVNTSGRETASNIRK
jgi:hypothetical protein